MGFQLGQDTTKTKLPPVPIRMTPQQKRAKLDSIVAIRRKETVAKHESMLDKQAAAQGRTREEMSDYQAKSKNKPDQAYGEMNGPNFKATKCGISKGAAKESKSDWKKK
jgi:hypothetical protein